MAIDFEALVVGPAMDVFAEPVEVWPKGDHEAAYQARGSWSDRPVDMPIGDDGLIASAQVRTLAIKRSEFPDEFGAGDWIKRKGSLYIVDDVDDDGQGGSLATLKEAE